MNSRANLIEQIFVPQWIARIAIYLLTVVFFYSGLDKALHFSMAQAEFDAIGLQPSALLVVATIVTQLAGAILLCTRRFALYGALLLAGFTAFATLIAHRFWNAPATAYAAELNAFLEHLGLIGAFLLIAHLSATGSGRADV